VTRTDGPTGGDEGHRSVEIARVLARHGLRHAGGVARDVVTGGRPPTPRGARELRAALVDLGPAYVKLGQLLSTRADLLPSGYQEELATLQAHVPPVSAADARATVLAELGRPVDEVFVSFDDEPLAAASIGQVHAATLADGDGGTVEVVVKVRRPDVAELVDRDVGFLGRVAALLASVSDRTRERLDPEGLVEEFAVALRRECDYRVEARVAERLASEFRRSGLAVHVPGIHREVSAAGVLTMDRVRGTALDDVRAMRAAGLDPAAVAESFANAFMSMVFTFGLFHADPHPGNVFVQPDGSLTLIDFGKHGEIDDHVRTGLGRVLAGLLGGDLDGLVDALEDLRVAGGGEDRVALRADLGDLVARYASLPLGELRISAVLTEVLTVIRRHRLRLPPDLMLLLATVVMCEGVAVDLDPEFEFQPVLARWVAQGFARRSPEGSDTDHARFEDR
jgi:ubiquinone biosynthesis protein